MLHHGSLTGWTVATIRHVDALAIGTFGFLLTVFGRFVAFRTLNTPVLRLASVRTVSESLATVASNRGREPLLSTEVLPAYSETMAEKIREVSWVVQHHFDRSEAGL